MAIKTQKNSKASRSVKPVLSTQVSSVNHTDGRMPSLEREASVLWTQAKLHWQLGEWSELVALADESFETDAHRIDIALFCAAACVQEGLIEQAKALIKQAESWGAHTEQIAKVFVSGVYNSLGKASLLLDTTEPFNAPNANAMAFFNLSAQVGLGEQCVPGLLKARTRNQMESIELALYPQHRFRTQWQESHFNAASSAHSFTHNLASNTAPETAIVSQLGAFYVFDAKANIWHRQTTEDFGYSDGDAVEERIFAAIESCDDVSLYSKELLAHQTDWASLYHLSADRVNVLRPFAAKLANAQVLELGCGCGAITRYLGELGAEVVALEGSPRRASIAASRCRDFEQVTVVSDKLQDFPLKGQFDVVTLIGVLEYSRVYVEAVDPIQSVLEKARSYLKPDGVLIVAIENQLGLKYFAGAPEDHGVGVMSGINDLYTDNTAVTFGRHELSQRFEKAGFEKVECFLPFPDYKLPMLMVHPSGYENEIPDWNLETLLKTSVFFERQPLQHPLFSLEQAWSVVNRNKLLADLANSHVFVAHKTKESQVVSKSILASYFSPKRAAEYSQQITFELDANAQIVTRRMPLAETSRTADGKTGILEDYISGIVHADLLQPIMQRPKWTLSAIVAWAETWIAALQEKSISVSTEQLEQIGWGNYQGWLAPEYLDAIPRNLIIQPSGDKKFIDLEWAHSHPLPLEMVVYRGLLVTLATLTSVAEPIEKALLDSEELIRQIMQAMGMRVTEMDFKHFMPVIDALARKAQGLAPEDVPITKPYDSKRLKVRGALGTNQTPRTTLTLYWKTSDSGYNENNTVKRSYDLNGEVLSFELRLPNLEDALDSLRLDIAGRQGCFFVQALTVLDPLGETLWSWNLSMEQVKNIGQLQSFAMQEQNQIGLISTGTDPQFELELAPDIIAQANGGKVMIRFTALDYKL